MRGDMNYNELIQLYFDRSNAMQNYWNLYVIIVGGILAFSSLRKQPAAVTTLLVCILFALFAYKNLDAMKDVTAQRFAALDAIKQFDANGGATTNPKPVRDLLEPTLTPATYQSVKITHLTSDVLTIVALVAMELRRRTLREVHTRPIKDSWTCVRFPAPRKSWIPSPGRFFSLHKRAPRRAIRDDGLTLAILSWTRK